MRGLVLLLVVGCYSPHPQPGAPCADGTCPDGLVCSPASRTCELRAIDASIAGSDAPLDVLSVAAGPLDAPTPTAQLVQQNAAFAATASQVAITLANLPASGNVLVFVGGCPQNNLDSVMGGGVATWTRGAFSRVNSNVEIWYGVTDGTGATVTAKLSTCVGPIQGSVSEWSGLTATPGDGGHATSGTTSPAAPGAVITTHAHDLLILGITDNEPNTFGAPGPGTWTALQAPNGMYIDQGAWYQLVTMPGAYDSHVTETAHAWDAALVALKIAP